MSEGTSATREVLDTATRITEAVDAAGLRVDHALKDSARRGALVRELTLFAERTTNDQLDRIGKMPDVAEYAGVGDGSVSDMVTGLIGGKASAEADVEMLRTDLDIMTKRAEDAESMAKLNVQYGPKVAVLEKERDGLIIKVGTCEQAAGEIIAERDGLRVQLTAKEEKIAPLLEAVDIFLEPATVGGSSTPVRRQLLTKRLREFRGID